MLTNSENSLIYLYLLVLGRYYFLLMLQCQNKTTIFVYPNPLMKISSIKDAADNCFEYEEAKLNVL